MQQKTWIQWNRNHGSNTTEIVDQTQQELRTQNSRNHRSNATGITDPTQQESWIQHNKNCGFKTTGIIDPTQQESLIQHNKDYPIQQESSFPSLTCQRPASHDHLDSRQTVTHMHWPMRYQCYMYLPQQHYHLATCPTH